MTFVKAATTEVPVGRSQAELQRLLRRYGASAFGTSADYETGTIKVSFRVPDVPGEPATVPIRLEVQIETVRQALYRKRRGDRRSLQKEREHAERVAWRHLVLWVDAALSAASDGVQRMSEAFLAHTLIQVADGKVMRVVDQMNEVAGGNWKALLPASTKQGGG